MNDYVNIVYDEKIRPFTSYPSKLVKHLIKRFSLKKNFKILELGCGRGEFLNEFNLNGLETYGIDSSDYVRKKFPHLNFYNADIEKDRLPFADNYFDVVYSKSFIEHFYHPDKIFQETYRVLKKNGLLITMTPEWQYIYKTFYEDYTHRVPFSKESLRDINLINGFKNVKVESFIQLPIIFESKGFIKKLFFFLSNLTRLFVPDLLKNKFKWVRFSKEIMLLSYSKK